LFEKETAQTTCDTTSDLLSGEVMAHSKGSHRLCGQDIRQLEEDSR
jgi:hypothetical protein